VTVQHTDNVSSRYLLGPVKNLHSEKVNHYSGHPRWPNPILTNRRHNEHTHLTTYAHGSVSMMATKQRLATDMQIGRYSI